jgi:hypothetical protein
VRRRRSGPTVSRNRNRYPEGCDQQSLRGSTLPTSRQCPALRVHLLRPMLPIYSTTCRSAACAPTLPVRRGPISSQRCSSSGVGSVYSAARRSTSIRRAMGDRGVDAGAACPRKAQPEIKSPASGILASGLILSSLHTDTALPDRLCRLEGLHLSSSIQLGHDLPLLVIHGRSRSYRKQGKSAYSNRSFQKQAYYSEPGCSALKDEVNEAASPDFRNPSVWTTDWREPGFRLTYTRTRASGSIPVDLT